MREEKTMKKRLLSLLLACLMLVSLVPTAAFAAAGHGDVIPVEAPAADEDASAPSLAAPAVVEDDVPADLADGENTDWCRPTDGVTVTASAVQVVGDAETSNDYQASYTPNCVLGSNYGWDFAGGSKNGNNNGRWLSTATKGATHILTVDLGTVRRVSSIHLYWFNNNFTGLDVDISSSESGDDWVNVRTQDSRVLSLVQRLSFAEQDVRRIRLTIRNADDQGFSTDADGYYDVSLYRVEAYQTAPAIDDTVTATPPADNVNMAEIQQFGHLAQPNDTFNCSSGKAKADNNIYIRSSASNWVTATSGHPVNTNRAGMAFDGDNTTGWKAVAGNGTEKPWIIVNLGTNRDIKGIKLNFGSANVKSFIIEGTTNPQGESWETLYEKTNNNAQNLAANLSSSKAVSFVRLTINEYDTTVNPNVVLNEMGIYSNEQVADEIPDLPATPGGNLCRQEGASANASSTEANNFPASCAIDGNTATRWASSVSAAPHTLTIDLGALRTVSIIKLAWERGNIKNFKVEISADNSTWNAVYTKADDTPLTVSELDKELSFSPVAARYIKVTVNSFNNVGVLRDGSNSVSWGNVSILEVEAYRDQAALSESAADILALINADSFTVAANDNKLVLKDTVQIPAGAAVTFAANLEQVVGADHTVFTPLVDTVVDLDVTVTLGSDSASTAGNAPIRVTIPGEHTANEGNAKPAVIPELMEWYSSSAQNGQKFTLSANSRIIHRYGATGGFDNVADELTDDLNDLFDLDMTTEKNHVHTYTTYDEIHNNVQAGDIVIYNVLPNGTAANLGKTAGFDDETYRIEITDHVTIFATNATGAYWATRTLLQALKLSGDMTVAQGTIRDYPAYKVRSFILDVGRKPMSMDKLREIAKNMAWYKMNDFHVHLNDNLIFLEDYNGYEDSKRAYSAFRLESDLQEEANATAPLAAKDYHYTKEEYKAFVEDSAKIGVTIVSEIDVPAHAKAIADAFPSVYGRNNGANRTMVDHLNLTQKYEESLAITQKIFDEYIDSGVFGSAVHFGADEYSDSHPAYRRYVTDMINYLNTKSQLTTKRLWGSLTTLSNNQDQYPASEIPTEGIQLNVWNYGWANPKDMYDLGFDLINCNDGAHYIVPYSGYYHPNGLGTGGFNWTPNQFSNTWIPASSSQMVGGAYAIWNDSIDTRANGVDEQDLFKLFFEPLPYYACALWGRGDMTLAQAKERVAVLSYAPNTNPTNQTERKDGSAQYFRYPFTDTADKSGNDRTLTLENATVQGGVLSLSGGVSYAEIGLDRLTWGDKLSFRVKKLEGGGSEQVIFEGEHAYGDFVISALPVEGDEDHWKLGFSRELYDYVFEDALLPVGEWVTLTLVSEDRATSLLIEGDEAVHIPTGYFLSDENSNTPFDGNSFLSGSVSGGISRGSSFSIPVARIGSKSNSFKGLVDDVYAAPSSFSASVEDGRYDIPVEQYAQATSGTAQPGSAASNAIDGNPDTVWHTTWNVTCQPDDRWFMIELQQLTAIGGLSYLGTGGQNGAIREFRIETSPDGQTWTEAVNGGTFANKAEWQSVRFGPVEAKYVRLWADKTDGAQDSGLGTGQFISAAEIRVCRPIRLTATAEGAADGIATITLDETSYPLVGGKAEPLPLVTFEGAMLVKDADYTVSYTGNTAAGTATVTVAGKGGYTGSLQTTFTVTEAPAAVSLADATVELPASCPLLDGKAQPDPVVTLGGVTLVRDLDYDVSYSNNTTAGATATVTITGIGSYEGECSATFTVAATIVTKDLSNTSLTRVTLHQLTFPYMGAAVEPDPVVTYDGETLVEGKDYTVAYSGNNDIGAATVTVSGILPYCKGTVSVRFTIVDPDAGNDLSNAEKTKVTFKPAEYAYTGKPIIPTFTVTYAGRRLTENEDYTVTYLNNVNGGTGVVVISGMGEYYGEFPATFVITGGGNAGGGSGGSSSGGSTTSSSKLPDGANVTTKTYADGAMTSTVTYPGGTKITADIPVTGPITAVVTVPASADQVTVTIPTRTEPTPGQVAVILHPDGTQEIVKTSLSTEGGVSVTLDDSVILQVVDNTPSFVDVPASNWAKDAITFVTSREIFNGTGNNTFSPNSDMSRAMVCTVLANLAGEDTKAGATWYEKGLTWAKENGVSDGTVPHAIITREQLAAMLYRYAGSPEAEGELSDRFRDKDAVSSWAEAAVVWAVENGLLKGRSSLDGLDLAPGDTATRAEVAAVLQRYVALISK